MNRKERRRAAKTAGSPALVPKASGTAAASLSPIFPVAGTGSARIDKLLDKARRYRETGRAWDAARLCRQIMDQAPQHPDALHLGGLLARDGGDLRAALDLHQAAAAVKPLDASLQCDLGETLQRLGQYEQAEAAYRRAVDLAPDLAQAHFGLANLQLYRGLVGKAVDGYRRAIAQQGDDPDYYLNLGNALGHQGQLTDALAAYEAAIALDPHHRASILKRGDTLRTLGRLPEAIEVFSGLSTLDPELPEPHIEIGLCLQNQGDLKSAASSFERALVRDPGNARAFYSLAHAQKWPDDTGLVPRIENALQRPSLEDQQRISLHFAAAKILDDRGLTDEAFAHYRAGNDLRARSEPFDAALLGAQIDAHVATFVPALFERKGEAGSRSDMPVFIVGMPRSGTTLVEQILASHPLVHGAGELGAISNAAASLTELIHGLSTYPSCVSRLDETTLRELADSHVDFLHGLAPEAARVTDKMPSNFMHLGLIALLFPKSRVIHCRRHPIDTCLSCYFQNFTASQAFSCSLDGLTTYYRQYRRLMERWRQVLPIEILDVDYEALVGDQERESRRLVEFCGLEWDDRCLAFHETAREVKTASSWQVRQPIYKSSVERWRRYEAHLGPLRELLET